MIANKNVVRSLKMVDKTDNQWSTLELDRENGSRGKGQGLLSSRMMQASSIRTLIEFIVTLHYSSIFKESY